MSAPDEAEVSSALARAHESLDEAAPLLDRLKGLLQEAAEAVSEARTVVATQEDDHARS